SFYRILAFLANQCTLIYKIAPHYSKYRSFSFEPGFPSAPLRVRDWGLNQEFELNQDSVRRRSGYGIRGWAKNGKLMRMWLSAGREHGSVEESRVIRQEQTG